MTAAVSTTELATTRARCRGTRARATAWGVSAIHEAETIDNWGTASKRVMQLMEAFNDEIPNVAKVS